MTDRRWPTDYLKEAERTVAQLWRTFPRDTQEDVVPTPDRDRLVREAGAWIAEAIAAAEAMTPTPSLENARRAKWLVSDALRLDMADHKLVVADVINDMGAGYAGSIEKAINATWDEWEAAEKAAGRPLMSDEEATADIADRLSW